MGKFGQRNLWMVPNGELMGFVNRSIPAIDYPEARSMRVFSSSNSLTGKFPKEFCCWRHNKFKETILKVLEHSPLLGPKLRCCTYTLAPNVVFWGKKKKQTNRRRLIIRSSTKNNNIMTLWLVLELVWAKTKVGTTYRKRWKKVCFVIPCLSLNYLKFIMSK